MLKIYNTLAKRLEDVKNTGKLNMYSCGPTVYNYAHIGNLRSFVMADLLYRTLKAEGYGPRWVMNITDIEDKIMKAVLAKYGPSATVTDLREYTKFYLDAFLDDLRHVNVSVDEIEIIRVTDVIPQIQDFIVELMDKGFAYKAEDGSTYFSIETYQNQFHDYGSLVGEKFIEGKKIGARVKVDEYDKDNLSDFALWKAAEAADGQIFWDHPVLGKGRPGWHIECSVINRVAFGDHTTDIHTGGVDLVFPHHTNETAQTQPLYRPFVNCWLHSEHLLVDGKKMSKSLGNIYTLKDLEGKVRTPGRSLRYFYLQAGYDVQLNFTWEGLKAADKSLNSISDSISFGTSAKESAPVYEEFLSALDGNLNSAKALAVVWKTIRDEKLDVNQKTELLEKFDAILGLGLLDQQEEEEVPADVAALLEQRQTARQHKDFALSDQLRDKIADLGWEVMDTPEGQKVARKI